MKTNTLFTYVRILILPMLVAILPLTGFFLRNNVSQPVEDQPVIIDFQDFQYDIPYRPGGFISSNSFPFCVESFEQDPILGTTNPAEVLFYSYLHINNAIVRLGFEGEVEKLVIDYYSSGMTMIEVNGRSHANYRDPIEWDSDEVGVEVTDVLLPDGGIVRQLSFEGPITSFAIGGDDLEIYKISLEGDIFPINLCRSAIQILLVTQVNKVAEYNGAIQPGFARGHPNQFNQWMVVVLDIKKKPLDAYGIWDPRLTLVHDPEGAPSKLEIDADSSYLFDIILPFTTDYNGGLPVEVLLYDQNLTLLADVLLTEVINDHCDTYSYSRACDAIELLETTALTDLWTYKFVDRPEADTNIDNLIDSEMVANCLKDVQVPQEELRSLLTDCGIELPEQ